MLDRALAVISIVALIAFMMIVTTFVNEIDLWMVVIIGLLLAINAFVNELKMHEKKGSDS